LCGGIGSREHEGSFILFGIMKKNLGMELEFEKDDVYNFSEKNILHGCHIRALGVSKTY
jgi:hypothetical protein